MINCDVILTYGWNRISYNILRNLSNHGLQVVTSDQSKHNMCSMSKYAKASFQYPSPFLYPDAFIDTLLIYIDKYKPKVLIPCHEETFVIAKYIDRFPKDLIIPIANYDALMLAHNKKTAAEVAILAKVPVPIITPINNISDITTHLPKIKYPVVLKLSKSNASKGVFYANSADELLDTYKKQITIKDNANQEFFIQEYVKGDGYGASFLYNNGNMISGFVHKRLTEKTHTGGVSTDRISVKNNKLFNYGKAILDELHWHGPAMIEFKYNEETSEAWFIEINPRYWGSLPLPIAAGLDIPYWHYLSAMNMPFIVSDYKIGIKSKWVLGELITLVERILSRKLKWIEVKSIFNLKSDNYDDFKTDDLMAFAGEIFYYLSKFIKSGGNTNPKVKGMGNL